MGWINFSTIDQLKEFVAEKLNAYSRKQTQSIVNRRFIQQAIQQLNANFVVLLHAVNSISQRK